jgi:hypothetical protein
MYKANACTPPLGTGWGATMAAEESPSGSTETLGAASEGACRLRHNKQGAWVEPRSALLKLGRLALAGGAHTCAT